VVVDIQHVIPACTGQPRGHFPLYLRSWLEFVMFHREPDHVTDRFEFERHSAVMRFGSPILRIRPWNNQAAGRACVEHLAQLQFELNRG
jgi:hypothetical protein